MPKSSLATQIPISKSPVRTGSYDTCSFLPTSLSPVRTGSYDTCSFLLISLSPVRTGSYDALLILLSLLEPVLTGDSILADVAVILDTEILKLPLIGPADFFYNEFVLRQVVQASCSASVMQRFVLLEIEIN